MRTHHRHPRRLTVFALAAAAAVLPSVRVQGQAPPIAPPGHGWFAWRDSADRATVLLHLPPRVTEQGAVGMGGVDVHRGESMDGVVRIAPGMSQAVEQIAWWNHRVYLMLQEDRTAPADRSDWLRRVVGLTAVRSGTSGLGGGGTGWQYPPGRPVVVATLGARSREVLAFGACRLGPVALVRHGARSRWESDGRSAVAKDKPNTEAEGGPRAGDLELVVHLASAWVRMDLPWEADGGGPAGSPYSAYWISGHGNDVTVYALDQATPAIRSFTATLPIVAGSNQRQMATNWASAVWPLTDAAGRTLPKPELVSRVDGVVLAAAWSPGTAGDGNIRLFEWTRPGSPPQEVPPVVGVPAKHRLVPMDGSGRFAVVWADDPAARATGQSGGSGGRLGFQIREVSITTGAVMYAGPLRAGSWLSFREYQLLALMLVLVMGSVVVFVLRTDPAGAPALPTGVAMAEPGRRVLATVIDFVPAALLMEALWALPTGTLLIPSRMAGDQFSLMALGAALGLAAAHAAIAEWAFGRSLGKLLTGCAVAGVRRAVVVEEEGKAAGEPKSDLSLSRPALWQCLIRNLVKWAAPVLGLFILIDPSRRHPGDVIARTMVLLTEVTKPE